MKWDRNRLQKQGKKFSKERFKMEIMEFVGSKVK